MTVCDCVSLSPKGGGASRPFPSKAATLSGAVGRAYDTAVGQSHFTTSYFSHLSCVVLEISEPCTVHVLPLTM